MSTTAQAAMADVFSAVASELALAQTQCARLDGALGRLLEVAAPADREAVLRELHVVDLLNQQIAAVAGFVGRLGDAAPAALIEVGPALQSITLGEVAERIGQGVGQACASPAGASEDIDFF